MSDRVVVIGDPHSVFVQAPVAFWRRRGVDAVILTSRWTGPASVGVDTPVFTAETLAPPSVTRAASSLVPFLNAANAAILAQDPARVRQALHTWQETAVAPSVTPPVYDALLIAAAADALEPVCVFGHEAFAYGLATSLCQTARRSLFAWGADVLQYAATSDAAGALVTHALHGVHYVLTNTASMEDALCERFGLPRERIARISYGVDRLLFCRATAERDRRIRAQYGIAPGARVLMNIRRFLPHWGSAVAWPAMLQVAERRSDVHLVLLGASQSDAVLDQTIAEAQARGVGDRATVVRGTVPLETVADLMSVADVSLSLVPSLEPVSWSVLQAAACGSAVVAGNQLTYRAESRRGLAAALVPSLDLGQVTSATLHLLDDDGRRARMARENDRFLAEHHDQDVQMTRLLRIIAGREADRLLNVSNEVG